MRHLKIIIIIIKKDEAPRRELKIRRATEYFDELWRTGYKCVIWNCSFDTDLKLDSAIVWQLYQDNLVACSIGASIKILKALIKLYGLESFTLELKIIFPFWPWQEFLSGYVSVRIFVSTVFDGKNNVSIDIWMIQFYQLGGMQATSHILFEIWQISERSPGQKFHPNWEVSAGEGFANELFHLLRLCYPCFHCLGI